LVSGYGGGQIEGGEDKEEKRRKQRGVREEEKTRRRKERGVREPFPHLVDDQQVGLGNTGPALSRDLITARNINHVDDVVGELAGVVC
jgi:hypothetical protein